MRRLRVALLSYRSKPHSGGQGVYVRHLSRELVAAGHEVTVLSGQPYPVLDEGVRLEKVPSLDLYREPDPFRRPAPSEFRDLVDVLEYAQMCTAAFPEPLTFSLRAARLLAGRRGEFDVVHDNQCLGYGLLGIARAGFPLVTTIHHPITRDRRTDLAAASGRRRLTLRRWYSFLAMQRRVARRQRHVLTVSSNSARDIVADLGVDPAAMHVVPLGVDVDRFAPRPAAERVPGRIVATASADTPLKGADVLVRALALLPRAHLVLAGGTAPGGPTERLVGALGLSDRVRFTRGLDDGELARLVASAEIACVPSRYEGFSLPALEAMASGTPLVASVAGAIPEVVGEPGRCADLVPAGDAPALAGALADLAADPRRREAMGRAGRERAVEEFSWPAVARGTVDVYRAAIAEAAGTTPMSGRAGPKARPTAMEGDAA